MTRSRDFPFDVMSVGAARRFAAEALDEVPTEVFDAVQLMVSELATNSIRHARTGFHLQIARNRKSVRVEVTDLGGGVPAVRSPAPTDPTGRGLAIVEMFSDDWGVDYAAPTDKTVWFTLAWAAAPCGSAYV
jgi:anti-sigma regulatory factor (Ser/Thr protein kinase)